MRTSNVSETPSRRDRFEYKKDRHYVLAQKESNDYDGRQLDDLMNETLPNGDDAYVIEKDGGKGGEDRRETGNRHMVLLSCSKDYNEQKLQGYATRSAHQRLEVDPDAPNEVTSVEVQPAVGLGDAIRLATPE